MARQHKLNGQNFLAQGEPTLIVVTGMSGAGRSLALSALEDFGYYAIDNLPPQFLVQIAELAQLPDSDFSHVAVACDIRGGELFTQLLDTLEDDRLPVNHKLLFLDADDKTLVNRFKESRRPHPLQDATVSLARAIEIEREVLAPIKTRADVAIDTSTLRASELRARIQHDFLPGTVDDSLHIMVSSFGFKYGIPTDVDVMFDVRFLPNPFYDKDLRPLSGLDKPVADFVLGRKETRDFLKRWHPLLIEVIPRYVAEGKLNLGIALGCTGGRHRSVALAEETARFLKKAGYRVSIVHRDRERDQRESRLSHET
ncbi:MAG: RNase adapter RapZ [Coriobacteriia bacterium]|nr:RNase adapter RapZ [Coriobacteriia bacterium]